MTETNIEFPLMQSRRVNVYCDTGGFRKELQRLEREGRVRVITFPYENEITKATVGIPSEATFDDLNNFTIERLPGTFDDYKRSDKYGEIEKIVGRKNRRDVLHLDSAFKSGCTVFLTNDVRDILSHRQSLEPILNMRLFNSAKEWRQFLSYIVENRDE